MSSRPLVHGLCNWYTKYYLPDVLKAPTGSGRNTESDTNRISEEPTFMNRRAVATYSEADGTIGLSRILKLALATFALLGFCALLASPEALAAHEPSLPPSGAPSGIAPYSSHPSELRPFRICPPPSKTRPTCMAI